MNKNIFHEVFIETEKDNIRGYLDTLNKMVSEEDFDNMMCYAEFLLESVIKMQAFESAKKIACRG